MSARGLRRLSQLLFLFLFLLLFRLTDYRGRDEISAGLNLFFRGDPLVAGSAMLGGRTLISLFVPALAVAALTLFLGRFFCGWVCPLGTCLDAVHPLLSPRRTQPHRRRGSQYYLLIVILTASLLGAPLVGYFDPFSLLFRALTFAGDPALKAALTSLFDLIYQHGPERLAGASEAVEKFLTGTLLPTKQKFYFLALASALLLFAVFAGERMERRWWCRNLCPLGALLSLLARRAPLRLNLRRACAPEKCGKCIALCRMGAIDQEGVFSPERCTLCLDCLEDCSQGIIQLGFHRPTRQLPSLGVSRRAVLAAVAGGASLPLVLQAEARARRPSLFLIRPPGALPEKEFLSRCVRCGECMKVCLTNALQPVLWEAGVSGVFSPVVIPRIGYCEYQCTLCGQVCPTGAIVRLSRAEKEKVRIGRAAFDRERCLPWAKGISCLVCEEMCPLPEKAIKLREEKVVNSRGEEIVIKRPYVVDELCIGCGMCENKCPLEGEVGVRISRESESRSEGEGP